MKLIIAGSRDITDYNFLKHSLKIHGIWKQYKHELEIVSGMARGADALGVKLAERNNLILHKFPANWNEHGKRAGPLRNIEMGNFADGLLALWDGYSTGTKHMIEYMHSLNKPVWVEIYKENYETCD